MSIGIDPSQIATSVLDLVSDAKLWVVHEAPLRVAARFHHRLVWIHPFTNGNGRHGRQAADFLMEALGQRPFTWGTVDRGRTIEQVRQDYLHALRTADQGDYGPLEEFVIS